MTKWAELASRCEGAAGADREIDVLIGIAIGLDAGRMDIESVASAYQSLEDFVEQHANRHQSIWSRALPRYTASIDAITALIERELPGYRWTSTSHKREDVAGAWIWVERRFPEDEARDIPLLINCEGEAATPVIALCAAFCRAMDERGEEAMSAKAPTK